MNHELILVDRVTQRMLAAHPEHQRIGQFWFIEVISSPAIGFGGIHRHVGMLEQSLRIVAMIRKQADAHRSRHPLSRA